MGQIRISSDVFKSAVEHDALKLKAKETAIEMHDFIDRLANAANHSVSPPFSEFEIMPLHVSAEAGGGVADFLLVCTYYDTFDTEEKDEIAADGAQIGSSKASASKTANTQISDTLVENIQGVQVADRDVLDFSFGVTKDQHHIFVPGIVLRGDTHMSIDQATKDKTIKRKLGSGQFIHADQTASVGNFIFQWVLDKLPEADKEQFLERCRQLDLVDGKSKIGFQNPSAEAA